MGRLGGVGQESGEEHLLSAGEPTAGTLGSERGHDLIERVGRQLGESASASQCRSTGDDGGSCGRITDVITVRGIDDGAGGSCAEADAEAARAIGTPPAAPPYRHRRRRHFALPPRLARAEARSQCSCPPPSLAQQRVQGVGNLAAVTRQRKKRWWADQKREAATAAPSPSAGAAGTLAAAGRRRCIVHGSLLCGELVRGDAYAHAAIRVRRETVEPHALRWTGSSSFADAPPAACRPGRPKELKGVPLPTVRAREVLQVVQLCGRRSGGVDDAREELDCRWSTAEPAPVAPAAFARWHSSSAITPWKGGRAAHHARTWRDGPGRAGCRGEHDAAGWDRGVELLCRSRWCRRPRPPCTPPAGPLRVGEEAADADTQIAF